MSHSSQSTMTSAYNFGTRKNMIKRARNNAKFHLEKKNKFLILRDTTEKYVPAWRYVEDDNF